jgi:hypothetical protein
MVRGVLASLIVLAWPLAAAAQTADPVPPQPADPVPPRISVSVSLGTLGVTDLQRQPVRAERFDEEGESTGTELLFRSVGGNDGLGASAAAAVGLSPAWALRVGVGVGRLRVAPGFGGPPDWAFEARSIPAEAGGDVSLLMAESALRFRIPSRHTLRPYLEVGLALQRWQAGGGLPDALGVLEEGTRVGGHAAVGGEYPLTDLFAVSLRASTQVFRTPLAPIEAGTEVGRTDRLVLTAEAPTATRYADSALELVRTVRLEAGLSVRPGGAGGAPRDRSAPGASSSVLHR